jgi:hypothetical protein
LGSGKISGEGRVFKISPSQVEDTLKVVLEIFVGDVEQKNSGCAESSLHSHVSEIFGDMLKSRPEEKHCLPSSGTYRFATKLDLAAS